MKEHLLVLKNIINLINEYKDQLYDMSETHDFDNEVQFSELYGILFVSTDHIIYLNINNSNNIIGVLFNENAKMYKRWHTVNYNSDLRNADYESEYIERIYTYYKDQSIMTYIYNNKTYNVQDIMNRNKLQFSIVFDNITEKWIELITTANEIEIPENFFVVEQNLHHIVDYYNNLVSFIDKEIKNVK